jgi:predicted nucleic acid-binding protein
VNACVLDASVVVRFWLKSEQRELDVESLGLLAAYRDNKLQIHVPDLLFAETCNVLWKATRFAGWPPAAATRAAQDLRALGFTAHPSAELCEAALALALAHHTSVYDAMYVALALKLDAPLYTADRKLLDKVGKVIAHVRPLV